jgi:hypothetical protein
MLGCQLFAAQLAPFDRRALANELAERRKWTIRP